MRLSVPHNVAAGFTADHLLLAPILPRVTRNEYPASQRTQQVTHVVRQKSRQQGNSVTPEAAFGKIPGVKVQPETVPEYSRPQHRAAEVLGPHVAGEAIIQAEIAGIGYEAHTGELLPGARPGIWRQALNDGVVNA